MRGAPIASTASSAPRAWISAIVDGHDGFKAEAEAICAGAGLDVAYREFDPDEYGEELDDPGYAAAERIALVILTATRRAEAR